MCKNQFYPTKMQNLRAIILTNQVKTTWPSSLGIPSNAVNILYVCYFLKLPKFNYLAPSRFFFFYNVSLYRTISVLCYGNSKRVAVIFHFFFILSPSLSSFFLCFFGGEGWGRLPQLIWDTRGANPK